MGNSKNERALAWKLRSNRSSTTIITVGTLVLLQRFVPHLTTMLFIIRLYINGYTMQMVDYAVVTVEYTTMLEGPGRVLMVSGNRWIEYAVWSYICSHWLEACLGNSLHISQWLSRETIDHEMVSERLMTLCPRLERWSPQWSCHRPWGYSKHRSTNTYVLKRYRRNDGGYRAVQPRHINLRQWKQVINRASLLNRHFTKHE